MLKLKPKPHIVGSESVSRVSVDHGLIVFFIISDAGCDGRGADSNSESGVGRSTPTSCPSARSKLSDDSLLLSQIPLKPSLKMTMIGTMEDDIIVDQVTSQHIVDDFELGKEEVVDVKDKELNKQKLRRRVDLYKIKLVNPRRKGKKLLVLDIDYTLFDHRSAAENHLLCVLILIIDGFNIAGTHNFLSLIDIV